MADDTPYVSYWLYKESFKKYAHYNREISSWFIDKNNFLNIEGNWKKLVYLGLPALNIMLFFLIYFLP